MASLERLFLLVWFTVQFPKRLPKHIYRFKKCERLENVEELLELMRLLERTLRFGEVIAGTASEEALVSWLARELEELGWEVCLRKIEVDS